MKSLCRILILLALISNGIALSQSQPIEYFIEGNPMPSPYISDWEFSQQYQVFTDNFSTQQIDVIVSITLYNGNREQAGISRPTSPIITTIPPGFSQLELPNILAPENFFFFDPYNRAVSTTGSLPGGEYELCIQLLDAATNDPLGDEMCFFFFIETLDPPVLIYPPPNATFTVDELPLTAFQWTTEGIRDPSQEQLAYRFVMVRVFEGQVPQEALLTNPPEFEQLIFGEPIFQWPENLLSLPPPQTFAWSVQLVEPNTGEAITELPVPRMITVTYSDDTTTVPNDSTIVPPPEDPGDSIPPYPPPEYPTVKECSGPTHVALPETPISIGMQVENNKVFDYPRAVPIRAEAIDWDLVEFTCTGCGDPTKFYEAVRDKPDQYEWELVSGEGSLNKTFEVDKIDSLESRRDEILDRINEINDSLSYIDETVDSIIPGQIESLENSLKDIDKSIARIDSTIQARTAKRDSLQQVLQGKADTIGLLNTKIDSNATAIEKWQGKIDSINHLLENNPSQKERSQQEKLRNIQEQLDAKQEQLDQSIVLRDTTASQLQRQIEANREAMEQVADNYYQIQQQSDSLRNVLSQLERQLFSDPEIRPILVDRRNWFTKASQFNAVYQLGQGSLIQNIRKDGFRIFVSGDSTIRQQRFNAFQSNMGQWNTSLTGACNGLSGQARNDCYMQRGEVMSAGNSYLQTVQNALIQDVRIDPQLLAAMDTLRQAIAQMEGMLQSAKRQVEQTNTTYQNSLQNFNTTIAQMEENIADLRNDLDTTQSRYGKEQAKYQRMVQVRNDSFELMRPIYLEDIAAHQNTIGFLQGRIQTFSDSILGYASDTMMLNEHILEVKLEIKDLEDEKARLEEIKINIEEEIERLEQLKDDLADRKGDLEGEKSDLEEELEDIEEALEELSEPSKDAAGPMVYYIPPPLEKVMKDKDSFEVLKKKILKAELEVDKALAFKEFVQVRIAGIIDKTAKNLVKYKELKNQIKAWKEEKEQLNSDMQKEKTEKAQQYQNDQQAVQNELEQETQDLAEMEQKIQELKQDSIRLRNELDQMKDQLAAQDSLVSQLRREVEDASTQLDYEEEQFRRATNTLNTKRDALSEKRNELESNKKDKSKLENQLARARAAENQNEVQSSQSELEDIEQEITSIENNALPSLENQVESAASSVTSARARVENARSTLDTFVNKLNKEQAKLEHVLRDSFIAKSERYETVIKSLTYWRGQKRKKETDIDETKDKRKAFQDSVGNRLDRDESIKAKQDELASLDQKINAAKLKQDGLKRDINIASSDAQEMITAADDSISNTKRRLKEAHEEMRTFLLKEFKEVEFQVQIKLTVRNNQPLDQYRASDQKEEYTGTLRYKKSRTPQLQGKKAKANIPSRSPIIGACAFSHGYIKDPEPPESKITQKDPITDEPRTIALIYRDGRKLWPEWPVIGDTVPLIALDVVRIISGFTDQDQIDKNCTSHEDCKPSKSKSSIKEPGTITWAPIDGIIRNEYTYYQEAMWEPKKFDTTKTELLQKIENYFLANELGGDEKKKGKGEIMVKPGTMLETTEELKGVPEESYEVQSRIVTGDHKGLQGERITFKATLIAGEAEEYKFEESGDTFVTMFTDGDGYVKPNWNFGKGYARFKIEVKWHRNGTVMMSDNFKAESPLSIQMVRFSSSAPEEAWGKALTIVGGGGGDIDAMAEEIPDSVPGGIHAIAGLFDYDREFVEKELVKFEISDSEIDLVPEEDSTKKYGLARTVLQDTIAENSEVSIIGTIDEPYEPVGDPASDEKSYSTEKVKRFKIGSSESMFVVELEEPISPEEELNGSGTLTIDIGTPTGILGELIGQTVNVNAVKVTKEGEEYVATDGNISMTPSTPFSTSMRGFTVELDSFVVPAKIGAGIGGNLQHNSLETPVRYYAELDHNGNFYGEVRDLPEITISKFKLRQGTHLILDMHNDKNPDEMGSSDFHGIMVRTADLEMPNLFAKGQGDPAVLSLRNSYIGSSGFGGSVTFTGPLFKLGYGSFELEAQSFGFTFKDNELTEGEVTAEILLPVPMEGRVKTTIAYTGTEWSATASTENPVSMPRQGITFSLLEGSGIFYDEQKKLATLKISGHLKAERFDSTFTITGFELNSDGEIKAESIEIHQHYAFSGGFDVHVESISFAFTNNEYSMGVTGSFGFPSFGIDELAGSITFKSGPEVEVVLTGADISFKQGPVDMTGKFSYTGREFKGEFGISINPVLKNGITALLIIGNTEDPQQQTFVYWYVEMMVPGKIPLGQSGFRVANFGGGLGYNYDPPVGDADGAPNHNESFSVKAILGIEDQTGGNLFASRVELVLTSEYLTLYTKAWVLEKENSFYGEGQLNCYWESDTVLDGHIAMLIGIPDADGDIFKFEGRINFFLTNQPKFRIWSQTIDGSVMSRINASARFDISSDSTVLEGGVRMYESGKVGLLFFDLNYMYDLGAEGHFAYYNQAQILDTGFKLYGAFSLDAYNSWYGTANIASGRGHLMVEFYASTTRGRIYAEGEVEYDVWIWSGKEEFKIEHEFDI